MTDSPVTHHLRRDLSIDQQLALKTAATRLEREFDGGMRAAVHRDGRFRCLLVWEIGRSLRLCLGPSSNARWPMPPEPAPVQLALCNRRTTTCLHCAVPRISGRR
jgi:hypothetical protein